MYKLIVFDIDRTLIDTERTGVESLVVTIRELLGKGSVFGFGIMPDGYVPVTIMIMAPGAFFVLACLTALQNKLKLGKSKAEPPEKFCSGNCAGCMDATCSLGKKEGEEK